MVAAIKRLGFDGVYNMNLTADLTIVEEANEFIERFTKGENLPLITSCSPGWVKFCEHFYPEFTDNISSCKSPQQMFGALYKTYFAEKNGLDPKDICFVSVIPCTAKKFEVQRDHQNAAGVPDVDVAITTRELAKMIEKAGIDFKALPDEDFDSPFRIGSGAGAIFGATGGVMEAALRTAYFTLTGNNAEPDAFKVVRAQCQESEVQEAEFEINGIKLRVAAVSGLGNTRRLINKIERGEAHYDFVEVMACPGGCVGGGGQPIHDGYEMAFERGKNLYFIDRGMNLRYSHENADVKKLYEDYLGEPCGHKAHHLLHTDHNAWEMPKAPERDRNGRPLGRNI